MIEAKVLYEDINLKQSAILVAHHLAENKEPPHNVLEHDIHFASKLFEIQLAKSRVKQARKERNESQEEIYTQRLEDAHRLADEYKAQIQEIFTQTFEG